ncbi:MULTISPECIES: hypothetical protein [unclassified Pseudomonas]|uniref:hypothetical protein n=1 Tax=unclassified Pseudomonas TaxID=196821 RepID=UPI0011B5DF12|nr:MULTISPECIES: hypothetical protein [unclassified Pseudomonas]
MKDSVKIALITAGLTGVFTVAASFATYWLTNKSPEMVYTLVGGPSFSSPDGAKRIFVLEVNNKGSKEIKNAFIQIRLPSGELSEVAADATAGVKIDETRSKSTFELNADILNPEDTIKISLLTTQQNNNSAPVVVARAPGIKATDVSNKTEKTSFDYIFAAITLIAVLAQLLSSFVTSRYKKKAPKSFSSNIDPKEQSCFIFGACGLANETPKLGTSYRSTADLLYLLSKQSEKHQIQAMIALKAHLFIGNIADASLHLFRDYIEKINHAPLTEADYKKIRDAATEERSDPVKWRNTISSFIKAELLDHSSQLPDEVFTEFAEQSIINKL